MIKVPELAASAAGDEAARGEDEVSKNLCITDYELTLSTSCRGSRGFTRASNRIKEGIQCSLRPTDVATGAPCGGRKAKADRVFLGGAHGLMCARIEALCRHTGGGLGPRPRAHVGTCGEAHAPERRS